ncbi:hypothetical protein [Paenarthrobacter nicotinovorans]|uniref:Uncharacterized protein n=2 Tax=Paenarthrobacter nicotinovorans TaxID=29320 RepID=Q8GAK0_PAENI|nr:hypothetical protein [Paenarthrobacter nicotinovorans]MBP2396857.1 guanyl-specific ribonuclease Sa [Paenarthrobacter nicotinovorans]CAD47904.1 hypothetical protein [Paenarthrobacter nicotinovorans]
MTHPYPAMLPAPQHPKTPRALIITLIVIGSLAVASVLGAFIFFGIQSSAAAAHEAQASSAASSRAAASQSAAAEAANKARAQREAAASLAKAEAERAKADRIAMEKQGWTYVSDYLYFATPEEDYLCPSTRYGCTYMVVTNNKAGGCPRGIGVRASFISASGVSVYNGARTTGALAAGEQAQLDFTDLSGQGASFRVDSMSCY